jgi:hypothetical protein
LVKPFVLDLARALLYLTPALKEGFEEFRGTPSLILAPDKDDYMVEENGGRLIRESTPRVG